MSCNKCHKVIPNSEKIPIKYPVVVCEECSKEFSARCHDCHCFRSLPGIRKGVYRLWFNLSRTREFMNKGKQTRPSFRVCLNCFKLV